MTQTFRFIKWMPVFVIFLVLLLNSPVSQAAMDKKEVLARYENAIEEAESLYLYEEDILKVLPRIRLTSSALMRDDLEHASKTLEDIERDLKVLKTRQPRRFMERKKIEWLETYVDIFQKISILGFLGYLFVKWPFYNRMLRKKRITPAGRGYLILLISGLSILFSFLDLSRYGESGWAFFDLQVVLVTLGGLLGGVTAGLVSAAIGGSFRLLLGTHFSIYLWMMLGIGVLAGLFSRQIRDYQKLGGVGLAAGLCAGVIHALTAYLPLKDLMPGGYFIFSLAFLSVLEGLGTFVFCTVVSGVLRDQGRREMERDLLETRLLFLQAQMRPHFLFNALNTISAICSRENAHAARELVVKLADFLRRTLQRKEGIVPLHEELAYIDDYLDIEKIRFGDRLTVVKEIVLDEQSLETKVPILILQPLVENAVRHGIGRKSGMGTLWIRIGIQVDKLHLEIEDDGDGMEPAVIGKMLNGNGGLSAEGLGIAVRNIHQRLLKLYGEDAGLHYESVPGKGTKVYMNIPKGGKKNA
ncbi:MAG: histidine kinase [Candidatus Omnitrophica bacterium]|nr:histidine kinase [Candidatus Omnitrophota bacterium]